MSKHRQDAKFIQICLGVGAADTDILIYALDEDGNVWWKNASAPVSMKAKWEPDHMGRWETEDGRR